MPDAVIGGGISALGSVAGGLFGSSAASTASKQQADAANRATQLQGQIFQQTQNNLLPYNVAGLDANDISFHMGRVPRYEDLPNALNPPAAFNPSNWFGTNAQSTLEQTPGYQFTLQQGLRGVQNSAAAQGRGVSGNALAGAGTYATGLANQTFNQQYQNALAGSELGFNQTLSGQAQQYGQLLNNRLTPFNYAQQLMSLGENAAAGQGSLGVQTGNAASNLITGAGNALASGTIGSANALTSGFGGALSGIGNLFTLNSLTGGKLFGGGGNNGFAVGDFGA